MLLNPRMPHREDAGAGEALVVAGIAIDGLTRERAGDLRRHVVGKPHRAAGERTELPEDGRLLDERGAERHHRAVAEHLLAEPLLLVLLARSPRRNGSLYCSCRLTTPPENSRRRNRSSG